MVRYATYIHAPTDDQETSHQHDVINVCLSQHELDSSEVDQYVDLARFGTDPGREQFIDLVEAIQSENYEYVVVWEISRFARLGSIYQHFFEHCEDAGTTIANTDGWVEERRHLTKRIESGVSRAQREGKRLGRAPKGFRRDRNGHLQLIHEADRDAGEMSYLEIRAAIERIDNSESYRAVAADTLNVGRPTLMSIYKDSDRRAWYLDTEADDGRIDEVLKQNSASENLTDTIENAH